MEASKCPKCGDEPLFIEHLSKWYCYGCNSYVDEEKHECVQEHAHEDTGLHIEEGVKALEHEDTARECKNCGAKLQDLKDGHLYCFMCETYQEEPSAKAIEVEQPEPEVKAEPTTAEANTNESQKLFDETAKPEKFVGAPEIAAMEPATFPQSTVSNVPEPVTIKIEEATPKTPSVAAAAPEARVRMCTSCGQPLKFIDKYSRYYCYACKKYAPRDDPVRAAVPAPSTKAVKNCPDCGKPLKYVEKYTEWYCYDCKRYPLRERAKAAAIAKSDKKTASNAPTCASCGDPLKYVPQYSRYYCYKCKKYAPKGTVQAPVATPAKPEEKKCPACHEQMKYVTEYNEWYCYKCRKYSLRPIKPILL